MALFSWVEDEDHRLNERGIHDAAERIETIVPVTNLTRSHYLSNIIGGNVYLKEEHRQMTNSFKLRGAANSIQLHPEIDTFVTASTGNHALAFCHVLQSVQKKGIIFVTSTIPATKLEKLKKFDMIELKIVEGDPQLGEIAARNFAEERGLKFISPYNDIEIIEGQGTCGLEILKQCPQKVDAIFVCCGGGGLISGIAVATHKKATVIGCQPKNSEVMLASIKAGKIVDLEYIPTLSDGSAGNLEPGAVTFDLCRKEELISKWISVTEEEIKDAIKLIATHDKQIIEGAAGVSVASFMKMKNQLRGKTVAIVLCGGSINPNVFGDIIKQ